jgi:hypothetical protein
MSCHCTNQKELNLEVDAVGTGWLTQCSPGGGEAWQKIHARSEKKKCFANPTPRSLIKNTIFQPFCSTFDQVLCSRNLSKSQPPAFPTANMPKRKLSELHGPSRLDTRKLSIKAVRLTTKFEQGVQILAKGLKTARGFERQKLSRREKTAKADNNAATLARLAEEVDALKVCDSRQVYVQHVAFFGLTRSDVSRRLTIKSLRNDISSNNSQKRSGSPSHRHSRNSQKRKMYLQRAQRVLPSRTCMVGCSSQLP